MALARGRRFTILDAMVLIGALALCLVSPSTFRALLPARTYWIYDFRQYWLIIGSSWLLAGSLALAILAVLVPRPAGRRRFRQPGIAAVVLIALTLAFNEVQTLCHGVTLYLTVGQAFINGAFWWVFGPIYELAFRAGLAVLSGWLTLALTGRWRSAAGWLDRSGRVVGWAWVTLGLVAWVIECQTLFNPPHVIPPGRRLVDRPPPASRKSPFAVRASAAGLTNLRELSLVNSTIADAGLGHLTDPKRCRRIVVTGTRVTPAAIAALEAKCPWMMIIRSTSLSYEQVFPTP